MTNPDPIAFCRPITTPVLPRSVSSSLPYPVTSTWTTLGDTFRISASTDSFNFRSVSSSGFVCASAIETKDREAPTPARKKRKARPNLSLRSRRDRENFEAGIGEFSPRWASVNLRCGECLDYHRQHSDTRCLTIRVVVEDRPKDAVLRGLASRVCLRIAGEPQQTPQMAEEVVECDQSESDRGVDTNLIQNLGGLAETFPLRSIRGEHHQRTGFQNEIENHDP